MAGWLCKENNAIRSLVIYFGEFHRNTALHLGESLIPGRCPGNAGGRHNWTPCRFGAPEVGRLGHGEHRTTGGGSGGATTRGWGLVTGGWEMGGWAASVWIWVKLRCDDCKKFPVEFVFLFPNHLWADAKWDLDKFVVKPELTRKDPNDPKGRQFYIIDFAISWGIKNTLSYPLPCGLTGALIPGCRVGSCVSIGLTVQGCGLFGGFSCWSFRGMLKCLSQPWNSKVIPACFFSVGNSLIDIYLYISIHIYTYISIHW